MGGGLEEDKGSQWVVGWRKIKDHNGWRVKGSQWFGGLEEASQAKGDHNTK